MYRSNVPPQDWARLRCAVKAPTHEQARAKPVSSKVRFRSRQRERLSLFTNGVLVHFVVGVCKDLLEMIRD
eukprot:7207282-Lingulodinium_polyedra.AAC.1